MKFGACTGGMYLFVLPFDLFFQTFRVCLITGKAADQGIHCIHLLISSSDSRVESGGEKIHLFQVVLQHYELLNPGLGEERLLFSYIFCILKSFVFAPP